MQNKHCVIVAHHADFVDHAHPVSTPCSRNCSTNPLFRKKSILDILRNLIRPPKSFFLCRFLSHFLADPIDLSFGFISLNIRNLFAKFCILLLKHVFLTCSRPKHGFCPYKISSKIYPDSEENKPKTQVISIFKLSLRA